VGLKPAAKTADIVSDELGNGRGWTYLTFFPKGTNPKEVLYDIEELRTVARENHYHLPFEVVAQHNKVVLTAYSDGERPVSPLPAIFAHVAMFAQRFNDTLRYSAHGICGKFGGIFERSEKGRVPAIYFRSDDALLSIYESLTPSTTFVNGAAIRRIRRSLSRSTAPCPTTRTKS